MDIENYIVNFREDKIRNNDEARQYGIVRLATFRDFPKISLLAPSILIRAGFYFEPDRCSIKCSSCKFRTQDVIQTHYELFEEHAQASPTCKYVKIQQEFFKSVESSNASNTIAIDETDRKRKIPENEIAKYVDVYERIESFKNVSMKLSIEKLAEQGFFAEHTNYRQMVILKVNCYYCNYECYLFTNSKLNNNYQCPFEEHKMKSPNCEMILKNDATKGVNLDENKNPFLNFTTLSTASTTAASTKALQYTGDFELLKNILNKSLNAVCDRPFRPAYSTEQARLESFREWPLNLIQQPNDMAKAGFYYYGIKDMVKCFYCNGGLRNWDPIDEPIVEHVRWFPKCPYIRQLKGAAYIEEIKERYKDMDSGFTDDFDDTPQYYDVTDENNDHVARINQNNNAGARQRNVSPRTLNSRLDLPKIRRLMTLGFKRSTLKQVIEKKLKTDGDDFESVVELMRAYYDSEETTKRLQYQLKEAFHLYIKNLPNDVGVKQVEDVLLKQFNITAEFVHKASDKMNAENDIILIRFKKQDFHKIDNVIAYLDGKRFPFSKYSNQILIKKTANEVSLSVAQIQKSNILSAITSDKSEVKLSLTSNLTNNDLVEEIERLKREQICVVCMDRQKNIMFLPCSHLAACVECSASLTKCPVCRVPIQATVRTYTSVDG